MSRSASHLMESELWRATVLVRLGANLTKPGPCLEPRPSLRTGGKKLSAAFENPSNHAIPFSLPFSGSFTYGYCSSIISTTLAQPSFVSYFALDTRRNAADLEGAINGLFQAGGLLGALSCTKTADWFGRRKALLLGATFSVVGGWVGLGFYFVSASGAQWRIPLAIQCAAPLVLACGVLFLPESPRWLLTQDRVEDAYRAFVLTHGDNGTSSDDSTVRSQFDQLHAQLLHEKRNGVSLVELFKRPTLRKRCVIGWLTMFGAQGTATLVINNYGPMLYGRLGFNTVQQLLIQCGWITVCPFGNWLNALVVDRIGRVRMLMFGFACCVVALVGECITLSIFQRTGDRGVASAAVFFLFLHIGCFSSSVDATSYIYASEIFPTPVRAKGLSVSISGLFIATILFLQAAPTAFDNVGWKYYLVFICVTSAIFVVMWLFFPETRQRSLEDIGVLFGDSEESLKPADANEIQEKEEVSKSET
ncbi:hypothetical protein T310_9327 [Rasamsonia emersonii CBS 393.64]|uniref:Major facilitator superfamily (MFS) profile domain-containing protein n=1 Tax=Rasamsonia emersonii (strain ATCC 16479 / CBS 393.64 / IMI 116815) TaxID=1408163 RepID=A0A0F4YFV1_RASE3|nr:hypothetical protein T310_9327 [Rasamsonia emersonii CBS 393.64]KKA17049.1 hypothetical protein T310_9327 [Rasamsonia emersonii CBS 393.64]